MDRWIDVIWRRAVRFATRLEYLSVYKLMLCLPTKSSCCWHNFLISATLSTDGLGNLDPIDSLLSILSNSAVERCLAHYQLGTCLISFESDHENSPSKLRTCPLCDQGTSVIPQSPEGSKNAGGRAPKQAVECHVSESYRSGSWWRSTGWKARERNMAERRVKREYATYKLSQSCWRWDLYSKNHNMENLLKTKMCCYISTVVN